MLDTRLAPASFPSASLRSPDGRSTIRVGEAGFDGLVKAYCVSEAWRLTSMKGISVDIVASEWCDSLYSLLRNHNQSNHHKLMFDIFTQQTDAKRHGQHKCGCACQSLATYDG